MGYCQINLGLQFRGYHTTVNFGKSNSKSNPFKPATVQEEDQTILILGPTIVASKIKMAKERDCF